MTGGGNDLRSDLELALIEALKDSVYLKRIATWDNEVRDCLTSGRDFAKGFRAEELPAAAVTAKGKPVARRPFSAGQIEVEIGVEIAIVTRGLKAAEAERLAAALTDGLAAELEQLRRSGNALGANTVVFGDVTSSATTFFEQPLAFAQSTTEFTVTKILER